MRKKQVLHPARLLACAAVCVFFLGGCAVPGSSSAALPGGALEENMGVGTALDDGALRVLSGSSNSTVTVFCGASVICTAPVHGSAYLLTDAASKDTSYFVLQAPQGSDRYVRSVYDKTGTQAYSCADDEYPMGLCSGWLLTGVSRAGQTSSFSDCRLIQLSSGKTQALPDGANQIFAVSPERYCVTGSVWSEDGSVQESSFTMLFDSAMQPVETLDNCTASQPYWGGGSFAENWLELYKKENDDTYITSYYNVSTGQTLENVTSPCGSHFISLNGEDGVCPVVDVDTGETVATMPYPCEAYLPAVGSGIYYDRDNEYGCDTIQHVDGTTEPLQNYSIQESDGTLPVLYADRLEVYDASGALLYTQALSSLSEGQSRYAMAFSGGRSLVTTMNTGMSDTNLLPATLYGAEGILWENDSYYTIYQAYQEDYLLAERYTLGTNSVGSAAVTDVLSLDGQPIITGLRGISGISEGSVLPVYKGFFEGWMDLEGNWLWKRSIWQTPAEEGVNALYND